MVSRQNYHDYIMNHIRKTYSKSCKKIEGVVFRKREEAFIPKMWLIMKVFLLQILVFQLFGGDIHCQASIRRHTFVVNTLYDSGLNATF